MAGGPGRAAGGGTARPGGRPTPPPGAAEGSGGAAGAAGRAGPAARRGRDRRPAACRGLSERPRGPEGHPGSARRHVLAQRPGGHRGQPGRRTGVGRVRPRAQAGDPAGGSDGDHSPGGEAREQVRLRDGPVRPVAPRVGAGSFIFLKQLREIVKGERDPRQLAKLWDPGCHKSEDAIAEELSGHWREDHLFGLAQGLKMYDSIEERLGEYEREILRRMEAMKCAKAEGMEVPPVQKREKAKSIQRRQQEPARRALFGMTGIDGTAIDGVGVETMEAVISEYGSTLEKFRNEDAFVSHLRLAPHMN